MNNLYCNILLESHSDSECDNDKSDDDEDTTPSPIIKRKMSRTLNSHEQFYCSTQYSKLPTEKNSLSPRLGLPKKKRRPCQPIRFSHVILMPPSTKIGDLTGNAALFLEMRPFDLRKSDTLFPERQWRERGGECNIFFNSCHFALNEFADIISGYAELRNGVYFCANFTTIQKKRMVGGVMTEYSKMVAADFAMFNSGENMLLLVLSKVPNQVAWELSQKYQSNCKTYTLLPSINIILEQMTPAMRLQLALKDDEVSDPLLKNFCQPIRLIGMYFMFTFYMCSIL